MTHAIFMLFICWVVNSLYLAMPESRRVFLMQPDLGAPHRLGATPSRTPRDGAAFYMLFICWVVDSLYLATPKSRRVVSMHS